MITVIQRGQHARVIVDDECVGSINKGLLLFVGVEDGDTNDDADETARKVRNMRIFPDKKPTDLSVTDIACAALNGIKMGDKTLTVRRANQGATQPKPEQESILQHAQQQIALQVRLDSAIFFSKIYSFVASIVYR